jgi:hypothetical protein
MSSLYVKINALDLGSGGGGGGTKLKGRKAVGFEQGQLLYYKFSPIKKEMTSQVSGFLFL